MTKANAAPTYSDRRQAEAEHCGNLVTEALLKSPMTYTTKVAARAALFIVDAPDELAFCDLIAAITEARDACTRIR